MSARQTLWDFIDSSEGSPRVIDSQDDGLDADYFDRDNHQPGVRWRVALSAGLGLVALVILIAVGSHMFRQSTPVATPLVGYSTEPAVADEFTATEPMSNPEVVMVHVTGAVVLPGVIELPADSRIIDALEKAGGARADAALEGINLARIVFDGEQIVVPIEGEEPSSSDGSPTNQLISLSRASQAELETLPRIGPATAQRIIVWRETHGPFRSVEDVLAVSGIGPATLEGMRALVIP
jgi:competence protein ComEA